ncbi:nitroreductase family protein [Paenibacillus turpanensis]|uniref:nitroreductase family protein n=1 Tax=Paenibacillus turpanensis TaxID=2689078 RepID=UPI00140BC468|nr:nitroreductase family protein [Paenibacillus turpanensis]
MSVEIVESVIKGRRSVRRFTPEAVSRSEIEALIECARYAPSDTNSQTWAFTAILDRALIRRIEEITWEQLHRLGAEAETRGLSKEGRLLVRSFGPYATAFSDAPALLIVSSTPYASKFRDKIFDPIGFVSEEIWNEEGMKSSCLAAQNVMLAAHARGLASCPMTGPVLLAGAQLKELLDIPEEQQINMVIALGYPAEIPAAPARKPTSDILRIID